MNIESLTLRELRKHAMEKNFSRYWKVTKDDLVAGIEEFKKTNVVPQRFKRKYRIGSKCEDKSDCRTDNCEDNICRGKKFVVRASNEKKLEQPTKNITKKNEKSVKSVKSVKSDVKNGKNEKNVKNVKNVKKKTSNSKNAKPMTSTSSTKGLVTTEKNVTRFKKGDKQCVSRCITKCEK